MSDKLFQNLVDCTLKLYLKFKIVIIGKHSNAFIVRKFSKFSKFYFSFSRKNGVKFKKKTSFRTICVLFLIHSDTSWSIDLHVPPIKKKMIFVHKHRKKKYINAKPFQSLPTYRIF